VLLTVLGCSGSVPSPGSPASGYLLTAGDTHIAFDLGNGTLAALQASHDPFELDALVLSHLHPDHCADVSALTVMRRYHPEPPYDPRLRRLPLYAPAEAPSRLAAAYAPDAAELADTDLADVYEFHALAGEPIRIGEITITPARVAHPCAAYGFRIEYGGAVLCYTGDTGPCDALLPLASGAHTLLAEASWTDQPDRPVGLHLSGRQAGELATAAGVGRLVVTHVLPWADRTAVLAEAKAAFNGEVLPAEPGGTYRIR
jgi:ribonuclease BN (tRNA processing enzyme)